MSLSLSSMSCSLWLGLSQEPRFFHVVVSHHVRTDLVQDMTTLRTRSRHSRTPRGSNDIQYQMAQFHCGTHVPDERARVSRETHPDEIDFEDPMIAQAERVIPENWKSAHQRTRTSRHIHPIRECLYTKEECYGQQQSGADTDLTSAQMFIQGNRLPRTPPRTASPRLPATSQFYHSFEDPHAQDIVQDFRASFMTGAHARFGYYIKL